MTPFVDDRLSVLRHLLFVRHRFLFDPDADELFRFGQFRGDCVQVHTWPEVVAHATR